MSSRGRLQSGLTTVAVVVVVVVVFTLTLKKTKGVRGDTNCIIWCQDLTLARGIAHLAVSLLASN